MTTHDREFMNRVVSKIIEIDGGVLTTYSANYDFLRKAARASTRAGEAAYARQQAMLAKKSASSSGSRRRLRTRRRSIAREEAGQDREAGAAASPPHHHFEFPESPARARTCEDRGPLQTLRRPRHLRRFQPDGPPQGALERDGLNGAGKSTLLKLVAGEIPRRRGWCHARCRRAHGLPSPSTLMELLDPQKTVYETLEEGLPLPRSVR